jgi:hypothetical protein
MGGSINHSVISYFPFTYHLLQEAVPYCENDNALISIE